MKLNEIVYFPAQLEQVETVKIHAEKKSNIEINEFNIGVELHGELLELNQGVSVVKLELENESIRLEIEQKGFFKFEENVTDLEKAKVFLEVQGVRILWSYLREDVYSITSKMLKQPVMIPTIDVMKTLEKAK